MSMLLRETALQMLGPGAFLAIVKSVHDPENLNRVQVRIVNADGAANQEGLVWARVATPFAGAKRGAFFIPDVDDEVVVVYLSGDPRFPVVLGGLWNGRDEAPEKFGGAGDSVDRWTITGKAGTRIAIVEESPSSATVSFSTPGHLSGTMTDSGGGSIEFRNSSQTSIKIDPSGVTINAPTGSVTVSAAATVTIKAPLVTVSAPMTTFNGIVQCNTLLTNTVVSAVYTPGIGNVL